MWGLRPTAVPVRQVAVSGRAVVFCTELACMFHGLLGKGTLRQASEAAMALWRGDPKRFVAAVRKARLTSNDAERALAAWPGPVIGWVPPATDLSCVGAPGGAPDRAQGANTQPTSPLPADPKPGDACLRVVCTDLAWTIAVLGRVEGRLLLPQRRAHRTWERLFGRPFALDDPRLAAVAAVACDQIGSVNPVGDKP